MPSLANLAREEIRRLKRQRQIERPFSQMSLLEFIPTASPSYVAPLHLKPLIERLERIATGEPLKLVVHTPPRHAKTETLLHFACWLLHRKPHLTVGYGTYAEDLAFEKSRITRDLADTTGLELRTRGVSEWRTPKKGGFLPRGIGGGLTGRGIDVGIVDDPVKDRLQAESAVYRERTASWFRSVFYTRRAPGASTIVNMARWHPDDLAGRILDGKFGRGWEHISLPAIDDDGRALWPERWGLAALNDIKETLGTYEWEALYQGHPRPRGGSVFGDPWGYSELPKEAFREAIGIDVAYTKKTSSDWSVIVVMLLCKGYFYVVDVLRVQTRPSEFKELLRAFRARYPRARIRWYASGTEEGAADLFRSPPNPIPVDVYPPRGDKFIRSIPLAAQWNAGRVLVPEDSDTHRWVNQFLVEFANFTGVNDPNDDQVDATAAAFDQLAGAGPSYKAVPEKPVERRPGEGGLRRM